jgi:hypothetical protein
MENKDDNILLKDLELDRVAFYGRTLSEYLLFFNLIIEDLKKYDKIIDCPSGASSFAAEVNNDYSHNSKKKVIGCDPLFDKSLEYLKRKGQEDISYVIEKVKLAFHNYNWNYYKTLENLKKQRTLALTRFALDYSRGKNENRYINAKLPKLPFDDKSFDLVLSGHFLFTYANKFDFEFHKSSVMELFRISAKEVRIYPIQQRSLQPYFHMKDLFDVLKDQNVKYELLQVPFEFQKGSNMLLRLLR